MFRLPCCLLMASALLLASTTQADEKSHRKAAEDLLVTMGVDKQLQTTMDQSLDIQVKQNPALAKMKPAMKKFFDKHLNWETLKGDFVKLYMETYSEQELRDIQAFYQTPTGKKMVARTPELTVKGMMITAAKVQANQPELERMMREAASGAVDQ